MLGTILVYFLIFYLIRVVVSFLYALSPILGMMGYFLCFMALFLYPVYRIRNVSRRQSRTTQQTYQDYDYNRNTYQEQTAYRERTERNFRNAYDQYQSEKRNPDAIDVEYVERARREE